MLHNVAKNPTYIKRIITCDEMWIYEYDVENVQQYQRMALQKSVETEKATSKLVANQADVHRFLLLPCCGSICIRSTWSSDEQGMLSGLFKVSA